MPVKMREDVGYTIKSISDHAHAELSPSQVHTLFADEYVNVDTPIKLLDYHFERKPDISVTMKVETAEGIRELKEKGNGHLDAVSNAIKHQLGIEFFELTYEEHALTKGSTSKAITYVSIISKSGEKVWGVGIHDDIIASSVNALFSAVNRSLKM